jgi:hypothetical protein
MAAPSRRPSAQSQSSASQLALSFDLPAPPQLIPLPEARRWLGVSPEAFAQLLCTGQPPVVHLGRKVRLADTVLLAWLVAQGPATGPAQAERRGSRVVPAPQRSAGGSTVGGRAHAREEITRPRR